MGTKDKRKLNDDAVPTKFSFLQPPKRRKMTEERLAKSNKIETINQLLSASTKVTNETENSYLLTGPLKRDCTIQTDAIKEKVIKTRSIKIQCYIPNPNPCKNCSQSNPVAIKITKRTPFGTRSKRCNTDLSFPANQDISLTTVNPNPVLCSTPVKEPDFDTSESPPLCENPESADDLSFVPSEPESESFSDFDDEQEGKEDTMAEDLTFVNEPKFFVFWSCLMTLFRSCFTYLGKNTISKVWFKGTLLNIKTICINNHSFKWKSQPEIKNIGVGNILLSSALLYSGNTFAQTMEMLKMINVAFLSKSRFFEIQKSILFPSLNRFYKGFRTPLLEACSSSASNYFSGDGRCDSPGYSAKYGTYSLMNTETNKIVDFQVVHVSLAGNSNRMEKEGLQILLNKMTASSISITSLTTDRHIQIRAFTK